MAELQPACVRERNIAQSGGRSRSSSSAPAGSLGAAAGQCDELLEDHRRAAPGRSSREIWIQRAWASMPWTAARRPAPEGAALLQGDPAVWDPPAHISFQEQAQLRGPQPQAAREHLGIGKPDKRPASVVQRGRRGDVPREDASSAPLLRPGSGGGGRDATSDHTKADGASRSHRAGKAPHGPPKRFGFPAPHSRQHPRMAPLQCSGADHSDPMLPIEAGEKDVTTLTWCIHAHGVSVGRDLGPRASRWADGGCPIPVRPLTGGSATQAAHRDRARPGSQRRPPAGPGCPGRASLCRGGHG